MDNQEDNQIVNQGFDISTEIVKWVKYDDKIKEYNDKCKVVREEKDKIGINIMSLVDSSLENSEMPKYSIDSLNTRVVCQTTNNYEGLTNKFLAECFREYFDSEEKAKELLLFLKNKRQVNKKMVLKREYMMN